MYFMKSDFLLHFREKRQYNILYIYILHVGLGISELFFAKSGMKQVVSMAKFGVEHEPFKIFDLRWLSDTAKVRKFKMVAKMAYFR